jgi:hypothetical protein
MFHQSIIDATINIIYDIPLGTIGIYELRITEQLQQKH